MRRQIRIALRLPPHVVLHRLLGKSHRAVSDTFWRYRDSRASTYFSGPTLGPLRGCIARVDPSLLARDADHISWLAQRYLQHQFNLLGSGWVRVSHGMRRTGTAQYHYDMVEPIEADHEGRWLARRITPANLAEARRLWTLIDSGYEPIDWHLDFKSGYRWSERSWYRDIRHGHRPGVDIKVPWELARMQHLPQLAWAYALAQEGREGVGPPSIYAREFRNQVLDFVATNPPRFGVNWNCTMDVAIRVANWLVAYDLFRASGAEFDEPFESVFCRSTYEHAVHIFANLEWHPQRRGNHYLADVVGLLYAATHLPGNTETDAWLAFSVQELVNEVAYQFTPDGANFEASTCYHRLSAELIAYATAAVLGLPPDRRAALRQYPHGRRALRRRLRAASPLHRKSDIGDVATGFPSWYAERLAKMAEFTLDVTKPDGRVIQIGDNDSGRFLKLQPVYVDTGDATAENELDRTTPLDGESSDNSRSLVEDVLDHRHVVSALHGLFEPCIYADIGQERRLEMTVVQQLAGDRRLSTTWRERSSRVVRAYPDFGIYVFRNERIFLAVRCGSLAQRIDGAHAHNDQLSVEITVDDLPIIVDPGSYVYTSSASQRNYFRSTAMHSTLSIEQREQNALSDDPHDIFTMSDRARGRVLTIDENHFVGAHAGFGPLHRRQLDLQSDGIRGYDTCEAVGEKSVRFVLAPEVRATLAEDGRAVELVRDSLRLHLTGIPGRFSIERTRYSPAYGVIEPNNTIRLCTTASSIEWTLNIVTGA